MADRIRAVHTVPVVARIVPAKAHIALAADRRVPVLARKGLVRRRSSRWEVQVNCRSMVRGLGMGQRHDGREAATEGTQAVRPWECPIIVN